MDIPGGNAKGLQPYPVAQRQDGQMVASYTTLSHLITDLKKAQLQEHLQPREASPSHPVLLVIDEGEFMTAKRLRFCFG